MASKKQRVPFILSAQTVYQILEESFPNKVDPKCAVYLTSILEYLTAEVLELAGNKAKERKSNQLMQDDIQHVLAEDAGLKRAFPREKRGDDDDEDEY